MGNDHDVFPEGFEGVIFDILTINEHFTTLRVVNPEEKMEHGGFAETGRAHDGVARACLDPQIQVLEQIIDLTGILSLFLLGLSIRNFIIFTCYAFVAKAHIFELYSPTLELELGSIR